MPVIKEVSKGGNVIYYINEQKGTVVAKVLNDSNEAYDIAESIVRKLRRSDSANTPFDISSNGWDTDKFDLDEYYVGVARCSPEDSFDPEIGKRIALARAQVKYHTDLNDKLARMSMYLCSVSQLIERRTFQECEQIRMYQSEIARGGAIR